MAPRAICGARCVVYALEEDGQRVCQTTLDLSVEIEKLFETMSTDVVRGKAHARWMTAKALCQRLSFPADGFGHKVTNKAPSIASVL